MVGNYQNNLSGSAVEFLKHGWDFFFPPRYILCQRNWFREDRLDCTKAK